MSIGRRTDMFDFWFEGQAAQGKDAIILAYPLHPVDAFIDEQFRSVTKFRDFSITRFGGTLQTYQLYFGQGYVGPRAN